MCGKIRRDRVTHNNIRDNLR